MTAKIGVRKVEPIEGGHIAWLYPGGADLDEVMLALAAAQAADDAVEWTVIDYWRPGVGDVGVIEDDRPTYVLPTYDSREAEVGYYRRLPWCTCGDDHSWHYEPSEPGPGAMLAVVVGGAW